MLVWWGAWEGIVGSQFMLNESALLTHRESRALSELVSMKFGIQLVHFFDVLIAPSRGQCNCDGCV